MTVRMWLSLRRRRGICLRRRPCLLATPFFQNLMALEYPSLVEFSIRCDATSAQDRDPGNGVDRQHRVQGQCGHHRRQRDAARRQPGDGAGRAGGGAGGQALRGHAHDEGIPFLREAFSKQPNLAQFEAALRRRLLETQEVTSIPSLDTQVEGEVLKYAGTLKPDTARWQSMADYSFIVNRGVIVPDTATKRAQVEAEFHGVRRRHADRTGNAARLVDNPDHRGARRDWPKQCRAGEPNQPGPVRWRVLGLADGPDGGWQRSSVRSLILGAVLGGMPGTNVPAGSNAETEQGEQFEAGQHPWCSMRPAPQWVPVRSCQ